MAGTHKKPEELDTELTGGIKSGGEEWGEFTVRYVEVPAGTDVTPLLKGMPGDLCQCPHWGLMLKGEMWQRYADGSEMVTREGELFYWPPGHTGINHVDATFIEFSPTTDLRPVIEHMARLLE
ncbi:hypothetical protein Skr01_68890 [Sphaerisporangium krabiense]|uniref:Cupin domain-containing protein n=1 Tax=Sphaerisporangium krabiense TaxID=763782 RepID=A0A7W8Z6U1_9ACTN|nr:cupin domain-containing protein [Sphaerisporangium krabiense]MBB5628457.1 hypothetical protein [Sphaerisporangium krabiense]GII66804.1 hypothetical protein Skr01_68890 [Sphaerisporangium krabiense]